MIRIRNLGKSYKDGTHALRGVSLDLKARSTAILGRNGAGKTTLLRILSTQLLPTGGTAEIDGRDVISDAESIRRTIVSIPQEAMPMGYITPAEHLRIYLSARRMPPREAERAIRRVFRQLGMWEFKDKASDELSGGMKRKIFVAMAIASKADLVFLDEPTVGLDPISRIEVWSALKKLKGNLLLTTHYLDEAAELCDDIVLIDRGRVKAHGTIDGLLKRMKGKVRVETNSRAKGQHRIGGLSISYVNASEANRYAARGYKVKQIGLEDLFIIKGERLRGEDYEF